MNQKCQLCSESAFDKLMNVKPANFSTRIEAYDIYKCRYCGLSTMYPFPTPHDIEELYIQDNIFSQRYDNPYKKSFLFSILEPLYKRYGADNRFIAKTSLKLACRAKTLLYIGCNTGNQLQCFLDFCPQMQAVGIDINPQAKKNADNRIKEKIIIDDFTKYEFNQHFDIITLKFVIEHLLDFQPYIEKIVNLLSPNGLFFLSTPDMDSPKARQMKADWQLINDPGNKIGHLRWFNRKSIDHLAKTFGLRIVKIINRGELLYHLPVKLQKVLISLLGKDETGKRFIKSYAPRITYSLIFDSLLAQTIDYGDNIYVFMIKKPSY